MKPHNWHLEHARSLSRSDRLADRVTSFMGSMRFIVILTVFITVWILVNLIGVYGLGWDPYPFILLNLLFSAQATYSAPLIMMAQNRQSDRDRVQAQHDYETNAEALDILKRIEGKKP